MILITSAAGGIGRILTRRLHEKGLPVRAFVKNEAQAAQIKKDGAREVFIGDLQNPRQIHEAMSGVNQLYHAAPTRIIDEQPVLQSIIQAAKSHKTENIVFHSVIHPDIKELPHHQQKLHAEERLLESGLPVTILRPSHYMQNYLEVWHFICAGVLPYPVACSSKMGVVDVEDIGEAASNVLANPTDHIGKTYELSGHVLDRNEMAAIWSKVMGHKVTAIRLSPDSMKNSKSLFGSTIQMIQSLASPKLRSAKYFVQGIGESWNARDIRNWPEEARDCYVRMMMYYDQHGLPPGDMRHLPALLGHKATKYEEFARREAAARGWPVAR